MMMTPQKPRSNFADRHLNTLVIAALVISGWVANYAILQNRIGTLEEALKDTVHRSEHIDVIRRTENLEHELVPRSEHLIRDEQLNKRLDNIQDQIKGLAQDISQIKGDIRARH